MFAPVTMDGCAICINFDISSFACLKVFKCIKYRKILRVLCEEDWNKSATFFTINRRRDLRIISCSIDIKSFRFLSFFAVISQKSKNSSGLSISTRMRWRRARREFIYIQHFFIKNNSNFFRCCCFSPWRHAIRWKIAAGRQLKQFPAGIFFNYSFHVLRYVAGIVNGHKVGKKKVRGGLEYISCVRPLVAAVARVINCNGNESEVADVPQRATLNKLLWNVMTICGMFYEKLFIWLRFH